MQAYQSPPCPYCGITWNQPGAQHCANCRNPLPPPPQSYTPAGYAPGPPQSSPYGPPTNSTQNYPQSQPSYGGQPTYGGQQPGYRTYAPGAPSAPQGTTFRLFGQTLTVPEVLPPAFARQVARLASGAVGVICLLVLFVGILPLVASGQISSANQSLAAAASHQEKVDAVFTQFFNAKSYTNDPSGYKDQFTKMAKSFSDGLTQVKADEVTTGSLELRLTVLQWLVPSKFGSIAAVRHRLNTALNGLKQADQGLTAAVNEANVIQSYVDALLDYNKMGAALGKHDWTGASVAYSDAHQKIGLAMSNSHAEGLPPQLAKQLTSFNDVLTNGNGLIQAMHAKDAAGIKKYGDAMTLALKAMSRAAETVPSDYETKTFGPMEKAYDAAMNAIRNGN